MEVFFAGVRSAKINPAAFFLVFTEVAAFVLVFWWFLLHNN